LENRALWARFFINRFSALLEETSTDCFAWALLDNHFHLLLCCKKIELSRFMRRLLTGYAINFNNLHRRSGHLFQNRYKSIICEEDAYLLELIRYIHLNPLRAKIVPDLESLDTYSWCGHAVLLGERKLPGQVIDKVLIQYGQNFLAARRNYRKFVENGIPNGHRPELVGGGLRRSQKASGMQAEIESYDERVLGSGAFVEALQQDLNFNAILPKRVTLPEIQRIVCKLLKVEPDEILRRTRMGDASEARALFCYIGVRIIGLKGTEVGRFITMGASGVSRAVTRGEHILLNSQVSNEKLKHLLDQ
jgi:REP element-mobilizing transposase RayT